jgi:hypothetical protein
MYRISAMKKMTNDAVSKARRVLPVLVYYALMGKTITYGELGEITGDHYRSFKPAFGQVQRWIREFSAIQKVEPLQLAIIVVLRGGSLPGPGAIRWRLEVNRLGSESTPEVIGLLFRDEQEKIFNWPDWHLLLEWLKLAPYVPAKTPISEITRALLQRDGGGAGESKAHYRLKKYISANPHVVDVPASCSRRETEFVFPSLDRADVMFEHERKLYIVEVKSIEADEVELTRGIYQAVKYLALSKALQRDMNRSPLACACLAIEGCLTRELKSRSELLGVKVFERIAVPNHFKAF